MRALRRTAAVAACAAGLVLVGAAASANAETLEWTKTGYSFGSLAPCQKQGGYDVAHYKDVYQYQCRYTSGRYDLWELMPA